VAAAFARAGREHGAALEPAAFADAALVVECVAEDVAVKRAVLSAVEPWLDPAAALVTNTSSLSLDELADALGRPEAFGGLHFMHPAHLTRVVEVVGSELARRRPLPAPRQSTIRRQAAERED
jgi:3-hydroxybutyryl-CoA dehydrogenase